MEIVLQGEKCTKFEAGQVVSGVVKVPATVQLKASDVTIGLIGVTEVKWVNTEMHAGIHRVVPPITLHETTKCLELYQRTEQGNIILKAIPCHMQKIFIFNNTANLY